MSVINTGGSGVSGILIHDILLADLPIVDFAIDVIGDGEIYAVTMLNGATVDTGIRVNTGPWRIYGNRIVADDTGIHLLSSTTRSIVADNVLDSLYKNDGILVEGDDNIIVGNFMTGGTIRITGDDNLITGNVFRSPNSANNAFIIDGDRNHIVGNKIIDDFGTSPAVGIQILSGATDNIIGANDLSQAVLPITDAGTGTIYKDTRELTWTVAGTLGTGTGVDRRRLPETAFIIDAAAAVDTAPTDASLIVDFHLNGTTIFTTQGNRPTIVTTAFDSGLALPDVTAGAAAQYLTMDIDQVGSTVAGADLVGIVRYVNVGITG